jgi:predicted nucleic acid-binding protein
MTLLDTSVVIDHARGQDATLTRLIPTVSPAVCGVNRAELLAGARTPGERQTLLTALATYHHVPIPDVLWDAGIAVPFPDVVLATVAIANGFEVWTRDKHFALMQGVLPGLRLFQEPP